MTCFTEFTLAVEIEYVFNAYDANDSKSGT